MPYRNLRTDFDRQKSIRLQEFITDWSTGTGLNQSYLNLLHITIVTYEMSLKINTFYNRKKKQTKPIVLEDCGNQNRSSKAATSAFVFVV